MQGMDAFNMPGDNHPDILVATRSADLIQVLATSLLESGLAVRSVGSIEGAVAATAGPIAPGAVLLDTELLGSDLERVLLAANATKEWRRFPMVLICDDELAGWRGYLCQGLVDDLVPRNMTPFHWRVRIELGLGVFRQTRQCEQLRERAAGVNRDIDPLTGLFTREAFLTMLFRETDRVQRMKTALSIILLEIDGLGGWEQRLCAPARDDLLKQVAGRVQRLLRTYDVFGRMDRLTLALCLPGCTTANAVSLAERVRMEMFGAPFHYGASEVHLAAFYGVAPSHGRSPLVVLRDAREALGSAHALAPGSIFTSCDAHPTLGLR